MSQIFFAAAFRRDCVPLAISMDFQTQNQSSYSCIRFHSRCNHSTHNGWLSEIEHLQHYFQMEVR